MSRVARPTDLKKEISALRGELRSLGRFGRLLGSSTVMQGVYDQIQRVAPTVATVLITGESGTGKELVAQTLHELSRRRKNPFIPVNCGAISPQLIESEVFGHEKGSFTGAIREHKGYFERANGGTLFLDEVTEMPVELQVKLLRVLEEGTFMRIGSDREIEVDVRIIAATNRVPAEAVAEGKLREDLLYRLQVFPLHLPPLRERDADVKLIAEEFLKDLNQKEETSKVFTADAHDLLADWHWPGNVRELAINAACLPLEAGRGRQANSGPFLQIRVGSTVAEVERALTLATLQQCGGVKEKAAQTLGVSLKTLYNRLREYESRSEAPPADSG